MKVVLLMLAMALVCGTGSERVACDTTERVVTDVHLRKSLRLCFLCFLKPA